MQHGNEQAESAQNFIHTLNQRIGASHYQITLLLSLTFILEISITDLIRYDHFPL